MDQESAGLGDAIESTWDAVIIGGGAAGLSAAQMLGRARRRVLVIDEGKPRNRFAAHLHGVLGHDGLDPAELLARGRAEVERYGVVVRSGRVVAVAEEREGLGLALADGTRIRSRSLVLATGITDALPELPGLTERWGRTVLHCPYCHGWEVRDQRLGVLATSPQSLHQAELVQQWSADVVIFTAGLGPIDEAARRRLTARGAALIASPAVAVLGDGDRVTGVRTEDGVVTAVDAIFTGGAPQPHDTCVAALGLSSADTPFGSFLEVDFSGRTSHPRVWAVGNVVQPFATIPVAMGAGSMAGGAVNGFLVAEDVDAALVRVP